MLTTIVLSACNPRMEDSIPAHEFEQFCLLTWKTSSDDFCFKIMSCAERNKFIHDWFPKRNAQCGIAELKKALTALPKGSHVFWEDWPPRKFEYPSESVIAEMIEFAKSNGIQLEQSPSVQ
ncbi:MAG: hypothetical protein ACR2II_12765 [Chthoniobacterales bacterium]